MKFEDLVRLLGSFVKDITPLAALLLTYGSSAPQPAKDVTILREVIYVPVAPPPSPPGSITRL